MGSKGYPSKEEDYSNVHMSDVMHKCFQNEIYVKKEVQAKRFFRLIVETPKETIRGQTLYLADSKVEMRKMKEKEDELYRHFYKKIMKSQKNKG